MSFNLVRSTFKTRLNTLGYQEWVDGFNFENIPSTILDGAFHIEVNPGTGGPTNQTVQPGEMPVTVRVFRRGFKNVSDAIDECVLDLENIVCDLIAPSVRLGSGIKNIVFDGYSLNPLAESNDNAVMLEINFTNFVMLQI